MGTGWIGKTALLLCFCIFTVTPTQAVQTDRQGDVVYKPHHIWGPENGMCKCEQCKIGPDCRESVEDYAPRFSQRYQVVEISEEFYQDRKPLPYNSTAYPGAPGCTCPTFLYQITEAENVNDITDVFDIDKSTGRIYLAKQLPFEMFKLAVTVRNTKTEAVDEIMLTVVIKNKNPNPFFPIKQDGYVEFSHHRSKRSVVPAEVTFVSARTSGAANPLAGEKMVYRLDIQFPAGTTDMLVELFAPDNETAVMMLCDVNVTLGSNLGVTSDAVLFDSSHDNITYDRAVIDLGNVVNSGADTVNLAASTITIEYEAVLLNSPSVTSGIYHVAGGAEYDTGNNIYVVLYAEDCVLDGDMTVTTLPTFNVVADANLAAGSSALVTVDMFIPFPIHQYQFRVFTPLDTVAIASICFVRFDGVGLNFVCGNDLSQITSSLDHCPQGPGNHEGQLTFPILVNKASREVSPVIAENRISVSFVTHVYPDASLVGNSVTLGLVLQVDNTTLWIGNQTFLIDPLPTSGFADPVYVSHTSSLTSWEATIGEPFKVNYRFSVPAAGTASPYKLELIGPFSSGAPVFKVCQLKVVYVGANFPCLIPDDLITEYSTREEGGIFSDRATTNLGYITNMALSGDPVDSEIEVELVMIPLLNHPDAVLTSNHVADFGVTVDQTQILLTSMTVNLKYTLTPTVLTNATVPNFNLDFWNSNSDLEVGLWSRIEIDMDTSRGIVYDEFDMEFLMPSDDTNTYLHICKVEVISNGKNVPCLTPEWANQNVHMFPHVDNHNDRAQLKYGSLCNKEFETDPLEDKAKLAVYFKVLDVASVVDNSQHWASVALSYASDRFVVGQLSFLYKRALTVSPVKSIFRLLQRTDAMSPLPFGFYAKFSLLVKIPNGEKFDVKVKAASSLEGFDICSVRVISAGDSLPCITFNTTTYESILWPNGGKQSITASLGIVQNFGSSSAVIPNSIVDDDTVQLEIIGYANPAVASAQLYDLTTTVFLDSAMTPTATDTLAGISTTSDPGTIDLTIPTPVNISTSVCEIGGEDAYENITLGQTKCIRLTADIPEESIYNLEFQFTIPATYVGKFEISDAVISFVGDNHPCVDQSAMAVFTGTPPDTATFALNYVCNSPVVKGDATANSIVIDAYVRAIPNGWVFTDVPSITVGTSVIVNAATTTVDDIVLTVIDPALFEDSGSNYAEVSNVSLINVIDPIPTGMTIGENRTMSVNISIPRQTSSRLLLDVKLPNDGTSACLYIRDIISKGAYGRNVIGADSYANTDGVVFDLTFNSTLPTLQPDYAVYDLGIVTNTGVSPYAEDDDIRVDFVIQMADCSLSANSSATFQISFGAKVYNYIFIREHTVQVSRTDLELPDIFLDVLVAPETTSTSVVFSGVLYHSNASTAEGANVSARISAPEFMSFQTISVLSAQPYTATNPIAELLEINIANLYFTDMVVFKATFVVNVTAELPEGTSSTDARFQLDVVTSYNDWSAHYASDDWYPDLATDQRVIFYDVDASTGSSCNNPLGMETLSIQDCQLLGSRGRSSTTEPKHGRKGGSSAWKPMVRDGAFGQLRYFTAVFGDLSKVTQVGIQQDTVSPHRATEFEVAYSLDGHAFYAEEMISVDPASTYVLAQLANKVETRSVRLRITNDTSNGNPPEVGVKFEFFGCKILDDVTPAQACAMAASVTTSEPSGSCPRSFVSPVADPDQVLVCDRDINTLGFAGNCEVSTDGGSTWKDLNSEVAIMIGYEAENNEVYAYAQDMQSILLSTDLGNIWDSVDQNQLSAAQARTWTDAICVEEDNLSTLDVAYPYPTKMQGNWGATLKGMFHNNVQKTQWEN